MERGGGKPFRKTLRIKYRADDLNSWCQTAEDGSLNTTNQYWNQGKQEKHPKEILRTAQEATETRLVLAVNSRTAFSFLHPRNNLRSTQQSGLSDKHRLVASNSLQHWCLNNPHKDQSVVTVAINCFQPTHNRHIFLLFEVFVFLSTKCITKAIVQVQFSSFSGKYCCSKAIYSSLIVLLGDTTEHPSLRVKFGLRNKKMQL